MKLLCVFALLTGAILCSASCEKKSSQPDQGATVVSASGDINAALTKFRSLLGDQLNSTTGLTTGRREINWDGVPDSLLDKPLPNDFFNPVAETAPVARQRGLAYDPSGGVFMVSSSGFARENAAAAAQFQAFSGRNTFANIGANLWEVTFRVAGTSTLASVKGFGAVFSDVDLTTSTSLEFFNGTTSLGKYFVPPHDATTSFSFLGVYFSNGQSVTSIKVSHQGNLAGTALDVSSNGTADLIVLDDFLYSEPQAR